MYIALCLKLTVLRMLHYAEWRIRWGVGVLINFLGAPTLSLSHTLLNIRFADKFNIAAPSIKSYKSALINSGFRRGALTPRVFWPVLGFNAEHRFRVLGRRLVAALVLDDPSLGVRGA